MFGESVTKLGDLGHAHDRSVPRPGVNGSIAGDPAHAPPEQLYGYKLTEWQTRRFSSDLYLLGSLVVYMFTNVSLTAQIAEQLHPEHHWDTWTGDYRTALPYLREAWDVALQKFAVDLGGSICVELPELTRYLTDPDPELRGHPQNLAGNGSKFGVRRFSSRFEVLARHAERDLPSKSLA